MFDNPGRLTETPKHFERQRRDDSAKVIVGHACDEVLEGRIIPSKWREDMVNCRNCKRNLVVFLGKYYMKHLRKQLQPGKTLILAGCLEGDIQDTAWSITRDSIPQPCPMYTSNAEETDTRIWLHCRHSNCNNILILSPDTDIYHIGLTLNHQKDVVVRTSTYNSRELSFLHLPALVDALTNDPDLSSIEPALLPQIFQTLFVATGCDYTSFFSGIGKSTFLRYFSQHSQFITGGQEIAPGTLANMEADFESGFMAFLRLVGVVYMKRHGSGFSGMSPEAYYNQFLKHGQTALQHHNTWLDSIRQCIWDRIQFENDMIPNTDALYRHWKRTCWVLNLWKQANTNTVITKPITDYGWKVIDGTL